MTRRRRVKVEALPGHLVRSERWNGLRPGDPVEVAGAAVRGATWRFQAHVRNTRNGAESVEVLRQGLQIDPLSAELCQDLSVSLAHQGNAAEEKRYAALAAQLSDPLPLHN